MYMHLTINMSVVFVSVDIKWQQYTPVIDRNIYTCNIPHQYTCIGMYIYMHINVYIWIHILSN